MTECGERVVVSQGVWPCAPTGEAVQGEVGWVIGHWGNEHAVVSFESDHGHRTADIPETKLRVLTPQRQAR